MNPRKDPKIPAFPAASPVATDLKQVDAALDEALDESFPASDPVAIHVDKGDLPQDPSCASKTGR